MIILETLGDRTSMSKCVYGCVSVNNSVCVPLGVLCVHMPIDAAVSVCATLMSICDCGHTYMQMCMVTCKYVCMHTFMYVPTYSGCSCACPICIHQPIKCMCEPQACVKTQPMHITVHSLCSMDETYPPPHEATDAEN